MLSLGRPEHGELMLRIIAFLILFIFNSVASLAHKPFFSENQYTDIASSFKVENPDISIVVYHEVLKCDPAKLWMKLKIEAPMELFMQLGIPEIERLSGFVPGIAIIAKGLDLKAMKDLPLSAQLPGYGAKVFSKSDFINKDFYEPYTATASWIKLEERIALEESGAAYILAWHPEKKAGKLWVAVGETEQFGKDDTGNFRETKLKLQEFHELGIYEGSGDEALSCDSSGLETDLELANESDGSSESSAVKAQAGGCLINSQSHLGSFNVVALMLLFFRFLFIKNRKLDS